MPTSILSNCEALAIGVTVTVVFPKPSTIGLQFKIIDRLFSTPSNSVVSTVADREVAINFPNLLAEFLLHNNKNLMI